MEKKLLAFIQLVIGYEWLIGGVEKIQQGVAFGNGFASMMTKTAAKTHMNFTKASSWIV